jgi:hypothetical protein
MKYPDFPIPGAAGDICFGGGDDDDLDNLVETNGANPRLIDL